MLELSFPAHKGASGAAVIELRPSAPTHVIHGVVIANLEMHLLPAQIVTGLSDNNKMLEEHKYFLPQGAAVHVSHLANLVDPQ